MPAVNIGAARGVRVKLAQRACDVYTCADWGACGRGDVTSAVALTALAVLLCLKVQVQTGRPVMKRREFILGSAAAAWPFAASAQQPGGMRRIGALVSVADLLAEVVAGHPLRSRGRYPQI